MTTTTPRKRYRIKYTREVVGFITTPEGVDPETFIAGVQQDVQNNYPFVMDKDGEEYDGADLTYFEVAFDEDDEDE